MIRLDAFRLGEVGDGAGGFDEDAVVGAGGELELLRRVLEEVAETVV